MRTNIHRVGGVADPTEGMDVLNILKYFYHVFTNS